MPPENQDVVLLLAQRTLTAGCWVGSDWETPCGVLNLGDVTHWMQMPEPITDPAEKLTLTAACDILKLTADVMRDLLEREVRAHMKTTTIEKLLVLQIALYVSVIGTVIWVVAHFIRKFW